MWPRPHHPPLPRPDEEGGKTGHEMATGVGLEEEADSPTMGFTNESQQSKLGWMNNLVYYVGIQITGLEMKNADIMDKNWCHPNVKNVSRGPTPPKPARPDNKLRMNQLLQPTLTLAQIIRYFTSVKFVRRLEIKIILAVHYYLMNQLIKLI
jgi:hypothetical protein